MKKWIGSAVAFCALCGTIYGFSVTVPTQAAHDKDIARLEQKDVELVSSVDKLSDAQQYSAIMDLYKSLKLDLAKDPNNLEKKIRLEQTQKKIKVMECKMWGEPFCEKNKKNSQ